MEQGASVLPAEIVREYEEKYFTLLEEGRAENVLLHYEHNRNL